MRDPNFPKPNYNGNSIVDALKSIGYPSSFYFRNNVALANGILDYVGSPQQNVFLLNKLKMGDLYKPISVF